MKLIKKSVSILLSSMMLVGVQLLHLQLMPQQAVSFAVSMPQTLSLVLIIKYAFWSALQ